MTKKVTKGSKPRAATSIRIDPELYGKAVQKCWRDSLSTKKRVTFSSTVEALIREWVLRK
jgi:hypothetical protein